MFVVGLDPQSRLTLAKAKSNPSEAQHSNDIHVDSSKIEVMKNWKVPKTPSEIRSFLGLACVEQEEAFQTLKDNLCNAPIYSLPDGSEDFVVYCGESNQGHGCVLMRRGKVIAYASRQLNIYEKNFTIHDFEMGAMNELNMRQLRWIELFRDFDSEIRYHPRKANVMVDALSVQGRERDSRNAAWPGLTNRKEGRWRLLRSSSVYDTNWVIVNRLTKSAYFLGIREDYMMEKLARLYINEIVTGHGVPVSIISDRDGRFTSRFRQTLQKALGTRLDISSWDTHSPLAEFSYNNSYHWSIRCAPFEALYGRMCRSPVLWAEIGEIRLIRPLLVRETTDKVLLIKERLKAARDRQKSYADNRHKSLEFEVGDQVLLKVSPWKGVVRFGTKGKLAPIYVGPFEILKRIGPVAYRLRLPQELSSVHDTFHVSNLKKCLADANLHVPLDEIKIDRTLGFIKEPIEIMDREVKSLKRSKIPIV
ncbi:putative reverse transcriptase domain-containing protein [Tanacetum coccineum]